MLRLGHTTTIALVEDNRGVSIVGVLMGVLTSLIGGWHITVQVLLILMLIDILSGLFKAIHNPELGGFSSKKFREGLVHKGGYILMLILAYQLDVLLGQGAEYTIRNVVCLFYIAIEGTSLIENLGQIGVPIPKFIAKRLTVLRDNISETGTTEGAKKDK